MTDTESSEPIKTPTAKERVVDGAKKTAAVADKVATTAEVANNAFGMIKWVAIAVVTVAIVGGGYGVYKMIANPIEAVSNATGKAVETVSDTVSSGVSVVADGASAVADGASSVMNRLQIPASNQNLLDQSAEAAFPILFKLDETEADGMRERAFRTTNFMGSEGRICKFKQDFGGGALTVFAAADIDDHKTSAALGSKDNRLIRMVIRTEDDDIMFNTQWDGESKGWIMRWKRTTTIKPLNDEIAEARLIDVLRSVPEFCRK